MAQEKAMSEIRVQAKVASLERVQRFVREALERADCPENVALQIEIAVEEIFMNISSYAYHPEEGEADIRLFLNDRKQKKVRISFIDSGKAFNPLEKKDADVTLSAEEREIGGLGIFMVKRSMDRLSYRYEDGKNILTIEKVFEVK